VINGFARHQPPSLASYRDARLPPTLTAHRLPVLTALTMPSTGGRTSCTAGSYLPHWWLRADAGGRIERHASSITFSFSVTATSGPLDGVTENGTFTYDSSSIIPGGLNDDTGLLTGLNFTWNGITYNQTTANTGSLEFDSSGNLTQAFFGNNCIASDCIVNRDTNEWFYLRNPVKLQPKPLALTIPHPPRAFLREQ
jgi:hypothetical protein